MRQDNPAGHMANDPVAIPAELDESHERRDDREAEQKFLFLLPLGLFIILGIFATIIAWSR
jgi:hypothetical protein